MPEVLKAAEKAQEDFATDSSMPTSSRTTQMNFLAMRRAAIEATATVIPCPRNVVDGLPPPLGERLCALPTGAVESFAFGGEISMLNTATAAQEDRPIGYTNQLK